MRAWKKSFVIVLTLLFTLVIFTGTSFAKQAKDKNQQGNKHRNFQLTDARGHWAESSIALMGSEGIVKGYEDGSVRPENNVSREEALALLVRQMGYNADGDSTGGYDLDGRVGISPWAKPWVALAVEKGLLKRDEISSASFLEPASRNEVAVWVVRASNLEGEALKDRDMILPFDDPATIPVFARGYINVAVKEGIITGYPGRLFRGNGKITRAEMFTVMFRARNSLAMPPAQAGFHFIKGMVAEVDDSSITIRRGASFVMANQRNFKAAVADDSLIYLDGKRAELDDIKKGFAVAVLTDPDGEAVVIIARSFNDRDQDEDGDKVEKVEGVIEAVYSTRITVNVAGKSESYQLAGDVEVELDGEDALISDLKEGFAVKMKIENGKVTEIKAISDNEVEVSGVLESVSQTSITLKIDGSYEVYLLAGDVEVELDGRAGAVGDLEKGNQVKLVLREDYVISIEAFSGQVLEGLVDSVGDKSITVKIDGNYKVFELADDVVVYINDLKKATDDLVKGMEIKLILDDGGKIKTIKARIVTIS